MTTQAHTPSADQLTLVAFLRAKTGQGAELGRRLHGLYEQARAEEGNINYDLHVSNEDPDVWMLYENWRHASDLEDHFRLPYMQAFVATLCEVLEGDMDLRRFSMKTPFANPTF
ncbi:antibiotic biosynthesis monooxygenase [Mesorhizobium sp. M1E.F.Ca.ET.045.02.1.1]|uniref:putative quinol monooxygenase n=1 Tax=unclassified Mesorhizobium TaxID=325217 RepID=UPI000F7519B1|nr:MULTISPECIES: putative quinol monooxygenase [unclassified Mesorhizobium]AZO20567.1 antibiotic biosynthesis monooxygenase [Mesorhizobium sp. M1E.F.Ca.ET.045.02.1.1]RUW81943.1 antibiotic biosynthesis monooxygenase [Mesorhizobium sp. M1E.F.Ca.ET.063.01.1.1]